MKNIPLNKQSKKESKVDFGDSTSDSKKRSKQSDSYRGKVDISSFVEDIMKDLKADPDVSKYKLEKKHKEMMAKRSFVAGLLNEMPNQDAETRTAIRKIIGSLNEVKNIDSFLSELVKHGIRVTIDSDEEGKKAKITYDNFDKKKKKNKFDDSKFKKTKKKFKNEEEDEEIDKKAWSEEVVDFYNLDGTETKKVSKGKVSDEDEEDSDEEGKKAKCEDCGKSKCDCDGIEEEAEFDIPSHETGHKLEVELPEEIANEFGPDDDDDDDDDDELRGEAALKNKNDNITTIMNHKIDHNLITNEAQYSSEFIKLTNMSENLIKQEAAKYKINLEVEPKAAQRLDGIIKKATQGQTMLNRPIVISQKENNDKFGVGKIQWTDAVIESNKVPDTFNKR